MTASPSSRSTAARTEASRIAGRAAGLPWACHAADRPPRRQGRQRANPRRSEQRRQAASPSCSKARSAIMAMRCRPPAAAISAALDDIHLDAGIAVDLDLGLQSKDAAGLLATLVKARGHRAEGRHHPLRLRSARRLCLERIRARCPGTTSRRSLPGSSPISRAQGFAGPFAAADGRVIHAAGGSEAQELAFALASAVAYLRAHGARRHRARRCAALDLFPPCRRPGPVPHHRQVPRDPETVGAHRGGLRARAPARRSSPPRPPGA